MSTTRLPVVTILEPERPNAVAMWRAYVASTNDTGTWLFTHEAPVTEAKGIAGYTEVADTHRTRERPRLDLRPDMTRTLPGSGNA